MPVIIQCKFDDSAVRAALELMRAKLRSMEPFMKNVGEELVRETQQVRFPTMTAPDGTRWAPLKPATMARKKKNADRILFASGQLCQSIRYQASSSRVLVGTNKVYGAIHQFGGEIPKNRGRNLQKAAGSGREILARRASSRGIRMPARPFLGFSEATRVRILEIAEYYLANVR